MNWLKFATTLIRLWRRLIWPRTPAVLLAMLLCLPASAADSLSFSIWHIDGHKYEWQVQQLDAGLPLEPSIRVPDWNMLHSTSFTTVGGPSGLDAIAPLLAKFDRRPIALRMNNVTNLIDDAFPRLATITEDNWQQSHLAIRRLTDGTLDDTPMPSPFAGTEKWADAGRRYAESVWMKKLQTLIPAPTSIILRENNEGGEIDYSSLYISARVFWFREDNQTRQFANLNTPRDKWRWENLAPIVGDDWQVLTGDTGETLIIYRWLSDAELDRVDLRAKGWVNSVRAGTPNAAYAAYTALVREQFRAFFDAFRAGLSPAWAAVPFRTVGYSDNFGGRYNATSLHTYSGEYIHPASLTDPQHAANIASRRAQWQRELADPTSWRELSIRLRGPTLYASAQNGTGDFVDAESYAGFMAHYLWAMQSPGRESRLVWWESYLRKPTDTVAISTTWQQTLTALGRPDLNALTVGQCESAVMERMREIHSHPLLLRYYREGTTTIVQSSNNTSTVQRVYATETSLPDSPRKLLAVYTPCSAAQAPTLNVGPHSLAHARWQYALTDPLEPLPPPETDPDCDAIAAERDAALQQLANLQIDLENAVAALAAVQQQLADETALQAATQAALDAAVNDAANLQQQLADAMASLDIANANAVTLQQQLTDTGAALADALSRIEAARQALGQQ